LVCGILVFLMQAGFTMIEVGSVRSKNVVNIISKNLGDVCVAAIGFWLLGYGIAYGGGGASGFMGDTDKMAYDGNKGPGGDYHMWFFQFAFAATAATIVSGAVAERTQITAYLTYTIVMTIFVYPTVVHWVWDGTGWLSAFNKSPDIGTGMIDFAGSGVVHMVGGFAGLAGAIIIGPRKGRFNEQGEPQDMRGHSTALTAFGTLILWTGWYGFNCGSTLGIHGYNLIAAKVATTTTITAASSVIVVMLICAIRNRYVDVVKGLNAALAGLVSSCGACSVMEPWAALLVGSIGGVVYYLSAELLLMLKIDDPLEASAVHGFCGIWGVIAVGFFANPDDVAAAYSSKHDNGIFYHGSYYGNQLWVNCVGALVILVWTMGIMVPVFLGLKFANLLRVDEATEDLGLDVAKHGGPGYTFEIGNSEREALIAIITEQIAATQMHEKVSPLTVEGVTSGNGNGNGNEEDSRGGCFT